MRSDGTTRPTDKPSAIGSRDGTRAGALLMIAAGLFMTLEVALLRFLSPGVDNGHILLVRGGVQLLFAAAWIIVLVGPDGFRTGRPGLHILRGLVSAVSWWFYFQSFRVLDLALSTTLVFSSQIFVIVLASLILGERLTAARVICTLLGFAGVVIATGVLQGGGLDARVVYGLTSALLGASLILMTRMLAHTERTDTTLFYIALFVTMGAVPQVMSAGQPLSTRDFWILIALGFAGTIASWLLVEAYRHAEVSAIAPFPYLRLVFAAITGAVFFGEPLRLSTVIGAALIVTGSLAMIWIERR